MRASVFAVLFFVSLVGCGGAPSTGPTTSAEGAHESAAPSVALVPWSTTFLDEATLAMDEGGVFRVDGEVRGQLSAAGALARDGVEEAALASDGHVVHLGRDTEIVIAPPSALGVGEGEARVALLELDAAGQLTVRNQRGQTVGSVAVAGATPEAQRAILFLTAVHVLDLVIEQQRAAAGEGVDEEDEADADAEAEAEASDEDLWYVPIEGAPIDGPADALVTIVEVSDFQCPYCSRAAATIDALRAQFPDDVRVVMLQSPLPFHENARPAAEAALEARAQGGDAAYYRMAHLLFDNQRALSRGRLEALAVAVGLDLARFRTALDTHVHDDTIAHDQAVVARVGAHGTPTFYVNGELIVGARPLASFVHAVERARARAEEEIARGTPRASVYEAMLAHARRRAEAEAEPLPQAPSIAFADLPVPSDAPALGGDGDAHPLVLQLFVDPSSTHASRVVDTLSHLVANDPHVRLVVRFAPRDEPSGHLASEAALLVARAAGAEAGARFALDVLRAPDEISTARLVELATAAHADVAALRAGLESHAMRARVDQDRRALRDAGLGGGPVVLIVGRRVIWGPPSAETLTGAITAARARPNEGLAEAPSDVAHAPGDAHRGTRGAAWVTTTPGRGDAAGADDTIDVRWAAWSASGRLFDASSGPAARVVPSMLRAELAEAVTGMRTGEVRRVWLPASGGVAASVMQVEVVSIHAAE
jgi:protein-disulfide isomerase